MKDAGALEDRLGHAFRRPELLEEALTHSSVRGTDNRRNDYERLEFLGDRVLGLVVAEMLWRRFPREPEGALTKRLAQLVRRETLSQVAAELNLAEHIRIAAGAEASQLRHNRSVGADVAEAVIGALYLDGGLEAAASFVRRYWESRLEEAAKPPRDPKSKLQEWAWQRYGAPPRYETVGVEGPDHRRTYRVMVRVKEHEPAEGEGPSKQAAEKAAAAALLVAVGETA